MKNLKAMMFIFLALGYFICLKTKEFFLLVFKSLSYLFNPRDENLSDMVDAFSELMELGE